MGTKIMRSVVDIECEGMVGHYAGCSPFAQDSCTFADLIGGFTEPLQASGFNQREVQIRDQRGEAYFFPSALTA